MQRTGRFCEGESAAVPDDSLELALPNHRGVGAPGDLRAEINASGAAWGAGYFDSHDLQNLGLCSSLIPCLAVKTPARPIVFLDHDGPPWSAFDRTMRTGASGLSSVA
jgi:hypothetical protein